MKKIILILLILLILPLTSALTISDTTFFSSVSNFTIFVDGMTLDNVTVTNMSIQFIGLTSVTSNFTNTNTTFDAIASFFDLAVNLTVHNVNTSTDLFTASATNGNFNATIIPGNVITILAGPTGSGLIQEQICNDILGGFAVYFTFMPAIFTVFAIILLVFMLAGLVFMVTNIKRPEGFKIDLSDKGFLAGLSALGLLGFIGIIFAIILGFLCTV